MAKLIYSMLTSLDGYTEDPQGKFGWGAPEDPGFHAAMSAISATIRTQLYGRRMYEMMRFWETFPETAEAPADVLEWARGWRAMEKVVFSRTLPAVQGANTRLERTFDPAAIRRLVDASPHDYSVNGPELAAQALRAGIVDEVYLIQCPAVVGGGKRFFPEGLAMDLALLDSRSLGSGTVISRYSIRTNRGESHG